jgi:hypothetical protein
VEEDLDQVRLKFKVQMEQVHQSYFVEQLIQQLEVVEVELVVKVHLMEQVDQEDQVVVQDKLVV